MKQFIEKIRNKENLSFNESKAAFELLMDGKAEEHEIFDFLTLLSAKGEASDEIAGGVFVLRNKSKSCLLYTSPSPRDRTRSRMPSSA